jgi:UTP:GlnB (protein PII) uridylyltransferase
MSRVSTRASRVNDAFYVTDETGGKILDPERQEELRSALLRAIGGPLR